MTNQGLYDGLGGEEVTYESGATYVRNPIVNGSLTVNKELESKDSIAGVDVTSTGSLTATHIIQDYSSQKGTAITNIPTEASISGGMWAVGSAASGATPSLVMKPGSAYQGTPLGICLADTASGNNAPILEKGFYKGLVAEADVNAGDAIRPGAGAGMNTVVSIGSDAAQMDTAFAKGIAVMGGGSEAVTLVQLK